MAFRTQRGEKIFAKIQETRGRHGALIAIIFTGTNG